MASYNNIRKEFVFIHEGVEYKIINEIPISVLADAAKSAKAGKGVKLNGSRMYNMTTLNATFKRT